MFYLYIMSKSFFLVFIFCISSLLRAQSPEVSGVLNDRIIYKSPNNGDTYVPARTTVIIRPDRIIMRGRSVQDFSFNVVGQFSGVHKGEVSISDDNQTIVFKPDLPFTLSEKVNVTFSLSGAESTTPLFYSFQITPMSDARQNYWLNVLRDKERKEMESFQKEAVAKNRRQEIQSNVLDTLPSNFPVITIDLANSAKSAPGNIFIAPNSNLGVTSDFLIIADNAGKPVFERDMSPTDVLHKVPVAVQDFKMGLHNTVSYFKLDTVLHGEIFLGTVYVLNSHYKIIDSFQCGNGYHADGHDFKLLPNGHVLLVAYDPRDSVDMRVVTGDPNASSHATVFGAIIQELDTNKKVIFQWRSWDYFNDTDATHLRLNNPNETSFDYAHINSVAMDTDGMIIASFRHMDEVTKINPKNGHIIWRWGGKHNYFTFIGDTLQFSHQHDVQRIPNGNITMWDNGNYHKSVWGDGSSHDTAFSRAIEYELDESGPLTARAVWEFRDLPFSSAAGNVQRLANGNTFIGFGFLNAPNAMEVTPNGEKVFQLSLALGTFNYRSFRFEFPGHSSVGTSATLSEFGIQSIYPNPAGSSSNLSIFTPAAGTVEINIVNILGKTVRSSQIKVSRAGLLNYTLDLQNLTSGMYYCKVSQNGNFGMRSIMVSK